MHAIVITQPGNPDVLAWQEVPDPVLKPGEALLEVKATAVNRADLLQRRGLYPAPPGESSILGLEVSGIILELPANHQSLFKVGQPVMALLSGGGYAEKVAVPLGQLMPVPAGLSFVEAAAIPEAFLTAFLNLFILGRLREEEVVLIHAGGSGVGTAAIQLVCEGGAVPLVTAGSPNKLELCRHLGARGLINYHDGAFAPTVTELTDGRGVDIILDFIGADYMEQNISCLAPNGRLLLIGQMSGAKASLDLTTVMRKRLTITGTTLRARSLAEKADLVERFSNFALLRFAQKQLKPVVESVLPIAQAAAAHRTVESNQNFGKVVLAVS